MSGTTSVGTTLAISAAAPATFDAAGYGAVVATLIGGIESIPAFGADIGVTSFTPLATGVTEKHKGPTNYGTLAPPVKLDGADAGQTLLAAAAAPGNNALYTFIATYPTGEKRGFQARVFGMPENPGSASNLIMATPKIEICTPVVKIPAA